MAVNKDEYDDSERLVEEAVEYLKSVSVKSNGSCIIGSPSENILNLSQDKKHDLIIIPSPYAERVEKDNLDSLGATVEILINKLELPLLLVRESSISPEKITENIVIPLQGSEDITAAEWVLSLADQNSTINILNIVRKEYVENIKDVSMDLLETEINEKLIELSLRKNITPLLTAIKKVAVEMNLNVVISNIVGEYNKIIILELEKEQASLLIVNSSGTLDKASLIVKEAKKNKVPLLLVK